MSQNQCMRCTEGCKRCVGLGLISLVCQECDDNNGWVANLEGTCIKLFCPIGQYGEYGLSPNSQSFLLSC